MHEVDGRHHLRRSVGHDERNQALERRGSRQGGGEELRGGARREDQMVGAGRDGRTMTVGDRHHPGALPAGGVGRLHDFRPVGGEGHGHYDVGGPRFHDTVHRHVPVTGYRHHIVDCHPCQVGEVVSKGVVGAHPDDVGAPGTDDVSSDRLHLRGRGGAEHPLHILQRDRGHVPVQGREPLA